MAQSRAWCFTLNNPAFPAAELPAFDRERYVVWQLEEGEQGTRHLQGYIECTAPVKLGGMKRWLPTAHFEPRRGTREQARDYCMKEDSRVTDGEENGPWQRGDFAHGGPGARNDINAAAEAIRNGANKRKIYDEHPGVMARYPRFVEQGLAYARQDAMAKATLDNPREWQQRILDMIADEPNDRQVLWVMDLDGGAGKTTLARYLVDQLDAFYSNGGKHADVTYAYNGERICIFDYVRDSENYVNYGVIEAIKNGILFSPKFESGMKRFSSPHVVIFANFSPDRSKMSADRWAVIKVTATGDFSVVP